MKSGAERQGTTPYPIPVDIPELAVQVGTDSSNTCMLGVSGALFCLGENYSGQLGDGTRTERVEWTRHLLPAVDSVDLGEEHGCAVISGKVACWGDNSEWQLGTSVRVQRPKPVFVQGLTEVVEVGAGAEHSCARVRSGEVLCWGSNTFGQLGSSQRREDEIFTVIRGLSEWSCGDGSVDEGEACDDWGVKSNDGCSCDCEIEVGWRCDAAPSVCRPIQAGDDCTNPLPISVPSVVVAELGQLDDISFFKSERTYLEAPGNDRFYRVEVPPNTRIEVTATSQGTDLILYAFEVCEDLPDASSWADQTLSGVESLFLDNPDTTTPLDFLLAVDAYDEKIGQFKLELRVAPGT